MNTIQKLTEELGLVLQYDESEEFSVKSILNGHEVHELFSFQPTADEVREALSNLTASGHVEPTLFEDTFVRPN